MAAMEAGVMRMVRKAIAMGMLLMVTAGAVAVGRWLGLRPDPRMAQVLAAPSALEQWAGRSEREGNAKTKESKPPLLVQAEAFALCLNPPKPSQRTTPVPRPQIARPEVKPAAVPPPLRLMGISYHRANPAESRALVGAPDGGCRWVKEGAEFGHLVIEKINRGSILCRDGGATQEMALEFAPRPTTPVPSVPPPPPPVAGDGEATTLAKDDMPEAHDGAEVQAVEPGASVEEGAYVRSAQSSVVYGKAVCEAHPTGSPRISGPAAAPLRDGRNLKPARAESRGRGSMAVADFLPVSLSPCGTMAYVCHAGHFSFDRVFGFVYHVSNVIGAVW